MERKGLHYELKDIEESKGIVSAYFSAWDNIDADGDITHRGAFTKTIKENGPDGRNRVKMFKNHNPSQVPGKVLELGEDSTGGFFVAKMASTTLGKDTLLEYKEGIITEHSFGFEILQEEKKSDANHIYEYKLHEVSGLTHWGANPETPVRFIKGIKTDTDALEAMKSVEKYLANGSFSDEMLEEAEKLHKHFSTIVETLKSRASTQEPSDPVAEAFIESMSIFKSKNLI